MVTLGGVSFTTNPAFNKVIKPEKITAIEQTYSSVAYFSWTPSIVGVEVILTWNHMPLALFNSIETLFQADTAVVLDPDDGLSSTYNVELTAFAGTYYLYDSADSEFAYRKSVELKLLILSEVA